MRFLRLFCLVLVVNFQNQADGEQQLSNQLAAIEKEIGGRLGVAALETGSGQRIEYRAAERFPMCSTFKILLVAAVLQTYPDSLHRRLSYGADDLLEWSPITKKHLPEGGMTLKELCAAAIDYSDNTAANLLLGSVGGPKSLTRYIRSLGDPVTRLDRTEPSLNMSAPGDERDTTTPQAMVFNLKSLLLGDKLSSDARSQLEDWLCSCTTGTNRIRAGLPRDWRVGDKTGTGTKGTGGDVAIVRPVGRPPILMAIYLDQSLGDAEHFNRAIARAASLIARSFGSSQ